MGRVVRSTRTDLPDARCSRPSSAKPGAEAGAGWDSKMVDARRRLSAPWMAVAGLFAMAANAQNAPPLPRWQSDRALASQLDAAVKVEGYSVRPPKGYRMQRGNG